MKELLHQLELLQQEELNDTTASKLEVIHLEFQKALKNKATIATDETPENIDNSVNEEELRFKEIYNDIQSRLEKNTIKKATEENNNLIAKREILAELKELAENQMDSLGDAFKKFNELKDKWRNTGNVPEKHYIAIQRDYRFYNEQFFYTIKIYKDLKEHDLKKNAQLKQTIIDRLQVLATQENIKELESGVKNLQNEWDEIGPTIDTEWEKLRDSFKELLNTIYQKIQTHHHLIYENMVQNLTAKNEIIEQLSVLLGKECNSAKNFEDTTKEVLSLQEAYKKIGFAKKKENEDAWNKFRDLCNSFFEKKKVFYDALKSKYEAGRLAKEALIKQAEALKDSDDWANSTQKIISLQKDWKACATAGYNNDNKLWETFRGHCDVFFNNKKAHYESQINEEQENLSKKLQLITRIQNFTSTDNLNESLKHIDSFKAEWAGIGFVPRNEKDKVTKLYNEAIQSTLKKLNLSNEQIDEMKFNSLVDNLKSNPEANQLVRAEKIKLKEELNKIENSISQKENNLLFFAKSKNAGGLLDDVKNQLEQEKKQAQALKDKIKKLV